MGIREAISNFHHEWKYLTGEDNIFALSHKVSGEIAGEIPECKMPTGEKYIAESIMAFRFEKGKIVEAWENVSFTIV